MMIIPLSDLAILKKPTDRDLQTKRMGFVLSPVSGQIKVSTKHAFWYFTDLKEDITLLVDFPLI
jgi:hypothetical protein